MPDKNGARDGVASSVNPGRTELNDGSGLHRIGRRTDRDLINHLCDLSLLVGACEGRRVVDARVVAKARNELKEIHQ